MSATLEVTSPLVKRLGNVVKIGRDQFPVANLSEAIACWNAALAKYGWGGSEAPACTARIDGKAYHISYNGRAWDAATGIEVPLNGRKTAAEREAEGWR